MVALPAVRVWLGEKIIMFEAWLLLDKETYRWIDSLILPAAESS